MKRFLFVLSAALTLPALSWAQGGCYGAPKGYGCQGAYRTGSGCFGVPKSYGYGCQGYTAGTGCIGYQKTGCYGGGPSMGFPPTASYERYERYDGVATLPPPRGYAGYYAVPAGAYAGPRPFAYGVDGAPIPRGAPRGDGKYATESGKPLPPGFVPWNGPIIGTIRAASGYNRRL